MNEKQHNGELYLPNSSKLLEQQTICLDKLYDFNQTRPTELEKRTQLLREMFAEIGKDCYIEPPFHAAVHIFILETMFMRILILLV